MKPGRAADCPVTGRLLPVVVKLLSLEVLPSRFGTASRSAYFTEGYPRIQVFCPARYHYLAAVTLAIYSSVYGIYWTRPALPFAGLGHEFLSLW
jgi:hypothetical protein